MAHAQHVTTLERPIAEVFAFLADGLNDPTWRPEGTSIELVCGAGLGAQYAQTMTGPGGRRGRALGEHTDGALRIAADAGLTKRRDVREVGAQKVRAAMHLQHASRRQRDFAICCSRRL